MRLLIYAFEFALYAGLLVGLFVFLRKQWKKAKIKQVHESVKEINELSEMTNGVNLEEAREKKDQLDNFKL